MRQAKSYLLVLLLCLPPQALFAQVPRGLAVKGEAEFRYFGLKFYDARLYTKNGASFVWDHDFALEISYARRFSQKALVNSTMTEIERMGRNSPDAATWNDCFRSVQRGHRYLAVSKGPDQLEFWLNGQKTCDLKHAGITRSFMGIFLGENTRSASFTRQLKGG